MVTLILAPNASIPARLSRIPRLRQWCDHDGEAEQPDEKGQARRVEERSLRTQS